ncbi:MAG: hypothetical protein M1835_004530 [Candelina submexicana]|nr:MAG: hypothetical protein M1835_004530 [Candelina submexicana]
MNYPFQWPGLTRGTTSNICDYSNVALDVLDEKHLDETKGVGAAAANVTITKYDPVIGMRVFVADGSQPIDWDGYALDVTQEAGLTVLQPHDDWKNLKLQGGAYVPPLVMPVNEITPEDMATILLPMDTTPPITTATLSPPPNAAGWNNSAVTVTLTATDDISGVAGTRYEVDGGSGGVSTQNREVDREVWWRVDGGPPEAVISYDAEGHRIVVRGRDGVSGVVVVVVVVDGDPVQPASGKRKAEWTAYGSDCAEDRIYRIVDRAGEFFGGGIEGIRCERDEIEFSVMRLRYNGVEKKGEGEKRLLERNTVVYRRVRGRGGGRVGGGGGGDGGNGNGCSSSSSLLLGVVQRISIGEGQERETVEGRWDALGGRTEGWGWRGCCWCCCGKEGDEEDEEDKRRSPPQTPTGWKRISGALLLLLLRPRRRVQCRPIFRRRRRMRS